MSFNWGRDDDSNRRGAAPSSGSMIGAGIAIGAGLGVALGVVFDNLGLGIAVGAAIGVAIGTAMEQSRGGIAEASYRAGGRLMWVLIGLGLAVLLGIVALLIVLGMR